MEKWLILYIRGGRIASLPLSDLAEVQRLFYTFTLQVDTPSGNVHLDIVGIRKLKKKVGTP